MFLVGEIIFLGYVCIFSSKNIRERDKFNLRGNERSLSFENLSKVEEDVK